MKERQIVKTEDGSHTIFIPELNEHYHSSHGAIQESQHIYIENAFKKFSKLSRGVVSVLEIGFGTGLNCLLTMIEAEKQDILVNYSAIEKYPLNESEIQEINYAEILNRKEDFKKIHEAKWDNFTKINDKFFIHKKELDLKKYRSSEIFDIIYFDAFAPDVQPDLWTEKIFKNLYRRLDKSGILITYSSKGTVKQALRDSGFFVQRLPGPKGKRHIVSATKDYKGQAPNNQPKEEIATGNTNEVNL